MAVNRSCLAIFVLLLQAGKPPVRAAGDDSFFENKIRPVLVDNCYSCHSASAKKLKGGLRLDTKAGWVKGGDSGPAIIPGQPEASLLIKAVRYDDKELQMPPKDRKLSEAQIADLIAWVKLGAPDPRLEPPTNDVPGPVAANFDYEAANRLWAFHAPADPPVPSVANGRWPKTSIDRFILARLETAKLSPAAPADRRTLLRRATFDLTGLPPTQQEMEDFLRDHSAGAFAKVVDRLLASPHYGECWARHWLDVVRYTDSLDSRVVGTDQDSIDAWRYRDWVVHAFNRDLPYTDFITEQIAGDLLPPPEQDGIDTNGIIATGMYALGNWGNGDADKDKILTDIADDAVDVTGRAFLGLTLACARCHDHKFDPIPTADYYSLAGIFFSSHILAKLTPKGAGEVLQRIPLISQAETERRQAREARIAALEKELEQISDEQADAIARRAIPDSEKYLGAVSELRRDPKLPASELAQRLRLDAAVLQRWADFLDADTAGLFSQPQRDVMGHRGLAAWRVASGADTPSVVANGTDQEIAFLSIKLPAHRVAIHPSPKDGVAASWKSPISGQINIQGKVVDVDPTCGDGVTWELVKLAHGTETTMTKGAIPNGGAESFGGSAQLVSCAVSIGDLVQLRVFPKAGYECDSTMIELELAAAGGSELVWNLSREVADDLLAGNPHADSHGNPAVWCFQDLAQKNWTAVAGSGFARWFELANQNPAPDATNVTPVAAQIGRELSGGLITNGIYAAFTAPRGAFWSPLREDRKQYPEVSRHRFEAAQTELGQLRQNPPPPVSLAHGLQEGGVPESPHAGVHDVRIHVRGRYDRLGDLAPRRFPRVLAGVEQPAITNGSGRLQLAAWLASPENPLTARVMVNRIWQHHFGVGIVRTPNNFGKLGAAPTHPELLDYLAHRFVDSGWSIKAMHRAIMLSATYQQSAIPDPATLQADPDNQWFGRMTRRRLDAEALRDSLLAVAGRLNPAAGGPAVRDFDNDRRTLYLMTIRSDRSNFRSLFDGADSTAIVEQRAVSTVAPQALFLLNNPFALAQARALAERVTALRETDLPRRIEWLYHTLYGRPPVRAELKVGRDLLETARREQLPAQTAWLEYCQALLCANEFVYVD